LKPFQFTHSKLRTQNEKLKMSSWQLLIVGATVGAFAISHLSDALIERKALALDFAVRQRIYQREARALLWWRVIDAVAIVLLILGILKVLGKVVLFSSEYGFPMMACGITLYCAAATLRAWMRQQAYAREAQGSPASSSARIAALLTTFVEVVLAGAACWYVFIYLPAAKTASGATVPAKTVPAEQPAAARPRKHKAGVAPAQAEQWLSESNAVKFLGIDADYLEVLVRRGSVRINPKSDTREYLRRDIETEQQAGLPTDQEVADELKQVKADRESSETVKVDRVNNEGKDALKE